MKTFDLAYGRGTIPLTLPEHRIRAVLESRLHTYQPELGEEELVRAALNHPEGSPGLRQLAKGKKKVVIIASDHTRPDSYKYAKINSPSRSASVALIIRSALSKNCLT